MDPARYPELTVEDGYAIQKVCDDLVRRVYGSEDFQRGVAAFEASGSEGRAPWTGR